MGEVINNHQFNSEIFEVLEKYPKLKCVKIIGNLSILKGDIDLVDEFGIHRDVYSLEIHPVSEYPYRFPIVFETGGKIPKNVDWHVFESDGHFCICVEPEEILKCKTGITLLSFIEQQLMPYLFNQTFRRLNGYYINERKHGLIGIIEYYQQLFKEVNPHKLMKLMDYVLRNEEPNRVSMCFCGSNIKYRKCHRSIYRTLHDIGVERVQFDLLMINNLIKQFSK